jgi:cytosine/adenosine deaminase-related metal-dependent hydrolase
MARAPAVDAFLASPLRASLFLEAIAFPAARAADALDAVCAWLDAFEERAIRDAGYEVRDTGYEMRDAGYEGTPGPQTAPQVASPAPRIAHRASRNPHRASRISYPASRITVGLAPHAPYTVSAPLARGLARLARERRLPIAIHLAETQAEREFLATGGGGFESLLRERGAWDEGWRPLGVSPVRWASDLGLLELPGAAVHLNYLSDEDVSLLKAGKLVPVWCPGSHRWFGHRDHPAERLIAAGVPVALGTDSLASNTSLDMLAEMRMAAEAFPGVPAETWLHAATQTAADAIGLGGEVGSLTPGKAADLIALRSETEALRDPLRTLIEAPLELRMAMVAGQEISIRAEAGDA